MSEFTIKPFPIFFQLNVSFYKAAMLVFFSFVSLLLRDSVFVCVCVCVAAT